jgi:hypothetical protein
MQGIIWNMMTVTFSMGGSNVLSATPTAGDACSFLRQTHVDAALCVSVDAGHDIGPGRALCGWNQPHRGQAHSHVLADAILVRL